MKTWQTLVAMMLLLAILPAAGHAVEVKPLSLKQALQAGGFELPAEWAGVWAYEDTTRDCDTMEILDISTGLDTLCAGMPLAPDSSGSGWQYECSGTASSTVIELDCSFSITFEECTITYRQVTHATRNGDTMRVHFRSTTTSTPTFCAFMPDSCEDLFERLTRQGPAPATCTTAVESETWSRVKTLYR